MPSKTNSKNIEISFLELRSLIEEFPEELEHIFSSFLRILNINIRITKTHIKGLIKEQSMSHLTPSRSTFL